MAIISLLAFMIGGALSAQAQVPPFPAPGNIDTNPPPTPEQIAAMQAAITAAQQAQFVAEFGPWIVQDASVLDDPGLISQALAGTPSRFPTANQRFQTRQSALQNIAFANQSKLDAEQAEVRSYAASHGIPTRIDDPVTGTAILRRIEGGVPSYIISHDMGQAQTIAVNAIWTHGSTGLNLNGEGTFMGVFDGGNVLTNHQEFGTRVSNFDPTVAQDPHSTHVVGVLASTGVNTNAIGMSPKGVSKVYPNGIDISQMPIIASTNHTLVSNHSYGNGVGWQGTSFVYIYRNGQLIANGRYPLWSGNPAVSKTNDYNFGRYTTDSTNVDSIVYKANTYLPVFSAGNERGPQGVPGGVVNGAANGFVCDAYNGTYGTFVAPGDPNFPVPPKDGDFTGYRTISPYASAKNSLLVGSVTNIATGYQGTNSVKLSYFSSMGPTADGRIKPDVVAPGENIYFPDTNTTTYTTDSGTSFSAPAVTGALNLIIEQNNRQNGTNAQLLASTLKCLAIHTADAAGANSGPNYQFGWGLFDAKNAATLFAANAFGNGLPLIKEVRLFDGDYIQFPVTVTNGTPQLKVTICWTDPAGTVFPAVLNPTNLALVNDLDVRIISPSGTTNYPWVLNPDNPAAAATVGDNFRDNVEQAVVSTPSAGNYTIQVTHKAHIVNAGGQSSAQWVSILTSGILPQPMPALQILGSFAFSTNDLFTLKWASTPGLNYQVWQAADLTGGNWQQASDWISATKTNTAFVLSASASSNQFFKIIASQP